MKWMLRARQRKGTASPHWSIAIGPRFRMTLRMYLSTYQPDGLGDKALVLHVS